MKRLNSNGLAWAGLIASAGLLGGCTADAAFAATALQDLQAFVGDFGRQVLTVLLL